MGGPGGAVAGIEHDFHSARQSGELRGDFVDVGRGGVDVFTEPLPVSKSLV